MRLLVAVDGLKRECLILATIILVGLFFVVTYFL